MGRSSHLGSQYHLAEQLPFDRVICAMHGILYVAQHRIHPDKIGQLNAFCTASSHYFQMMLIGGLNGIETGQTI